MEGHAVFRESLALLLQWRADLHSVHAGSLAEARPTLSGLSGQVNLAIVDLDLPDGDGAGLIENIRESVPGVPVLALANDRSSERRARAVRAGADEVISLASPVDALVDTAERLVRG